ncbi:hypothetical protein NDU88_002848 [Pleurodeles waltl]|uniref:Uncharacterized protein n=1 Tax=Pleurodeles waltl TaxID=8319 RepID=A0AAV7VBR3_PLEWA|nr:hypothetical protein NDU88_002848 [Pleurodeles waltl]
MPQSHKSFQWWTPFFTECDASWKLPRLLELTTSLERLTPGDGNHVCSGATGSGCCGAAGGACGGVSRGGACGGVRRGSACSGLCGSGAGGRLCGVVRVVGSVAAVLAAGSVAAVLVAGSVAAVLAAGSVAAMLVAGSVAAVLAAGSVASVLAAGSVAVELAVGSVVGVLVAGSVAAVQVAVQVAVFSAVQVGVDVERRCNTGHSVSATIPSPDLPFSFWPFPSFDDGAAVLPLSPFVFPDPLVADVFCFSPRDVGNFFSLAGGGMSLPSLLGTLTALMVGAL